MHMRLHLFITSLIYTLSITPAFNSPQDFFENDYTFFNSHFYKIDPAYYASHLENPLNLSVGFMLECLSHLYAKRSDLVCDSIHKDKEIDAIIIAPHGAQAGISIRFVSLKKSLEEHNWKFRKIYIFVINAEHEQKCKKELMHVFPENHDRLPIEWIYNHHQSELYRYGLKSLKYSNSLASYHIFIEESEYLAEEYILESCKLLADTSICLGANIFPAKNFFQNAIIHKYHIFYPHYDDMICAWFHTEMNWYTRALHYNLLYSKNIEAKEKFICKRIRQKESHHDLEESYYFKKLAILHLQKSLTAKDQVSRFIELLCSLGTLLYAEEIYKSENKNVYHIDTQIQTLKKALLVNFSKKDLNLLEEQNSLIELYKKTLNNVCEQIADRWSTVNSENIYCAYQEISQLRESFFKKIIEDSLAVVGTPPCIFAVVLYGSMARKEATPYSDVEFGFLIEKSTQTEKFYFEKLGAVILYKLMALGKNTVSNLNIVNLNKDFLTGNYSMFIEDLMPAGFSPDGLNHRLPIARKGYNSYCGDASEMIDMYYINDTNKPTFFVTEKFLYGDESLFLEYLERRFKHFSHREKSYNTLKKEMPLFSRILKTHTGKINIKTTFYRPLTSNLESFATYFGLKELNTQGRIMELHSSGYITDDEAKILENFLKKILFIRLTIDMNNKKRYGDYSPEQQSYVDELFVLKNKVCIIFNRLFESLKTTYHC